jgi:hypothetical protein
LALDSLADFSAQSNGSIVTVTNSATGWAYPAEEGLGTGFTFAVTTEGQTQVTDSIWINVFSVLGDALWSSDEELMNHEPDIRKWVWPGRNSFKNIHRQVQKDILYYFDRIGAVDVFEEKFTKEDVIDVNELREWATYMALRKIFEGIKNATDDVFTQKRQTYESFELAARQRALVRFDVNNDGIADSDEGFDNTSIRLYMR